MMGYTIELLNDWLTTQAFAPLIQQTGDSLRVATSLAFVVALFVLGVTYLLASIVRLDVVSPRNAILWYLAGVIFFQVGPALYQRHERLPPHAQLGLLPERAERHAGRGRVGAFVLAEQRADDATWASSSPATTSGRTWAVPVGTARRSWSTAWTWRWPTCAPTAST